MKKRIMSLVLIIILIMAPFSIFLNVYATDITMTNFTLTVDANNKVIDVTHVENNETIHGGTITVYDVNTEYTAADGFSFASGHSDTFKAYKIVDTYYDSTTNQFSYQFTTDFQSFLNDSTYANDNTVHGLTVNGYLALTSDEYSDSGNATSSSIATSSTLNILVSKYATFIRKKASTVSPITGLTMTNGNYGGNGSGSSADAQLTSAVPGSYLILPDTVLSRTQDDYVYGYTYGAMVANVFFNVSNSGEWQLNDAAIFSKNSSVSGDTNLYPYSVYDCMNLDFDGLTPEEQATLMSRVGYTTTGTSGQSLALLIDSHTSSVPTNTHSSITSDIQYLLKSVKVSLPSGLTFDYTEVYHENIKLTNTNDEYHYQSDNQDYLLIKKINNSTLRSYHYDTMVDVVVSNSYAFTAGANNTITVEEYYLKDPYVDIGSNVTEATIDAAFENEGTAGDTNQYAAIRQAIGKLTYNLNVVLYGVRVINTNSSNANLTGGVFQAYSDSNCTAGNEIGQPFTVQTVGNDTYGQFVGIAGYETVYLKQISAPSGYRLIDTPIEVDPTSLTLGQDGYYEVTAVNQPILALPFTGGSGTVIYTVIGLIIVAGAGIFLVLYKENNKSENKLKKLYKK